MKILSYLLLFRLSFFSANKPFIQEKTYDKILFMRFELLSLCYKSCKACQSPLARKEYKDLSRIFLFQMLMNVCQEKLTVILMLSVSILRDLISVTVNQVTREMATHVEVCCQ